MVSLKQYLENNGIAGLDGWHLTDARGISGDGRTIVGTGVNPQGLSEGWVATIDLDGPGIGTGEIASPLAIISLVGSTAGGLVEIQNGDDRYLGFRARGSELMQVVVEVDSLGPP